MQAITWYPFPQTFNSKLCVIPDSGEGESQYEAFQAIFADIMSATYDTKTVKKRREKKRDVIAYESPYEMLCRKNGVKLIPSNTRPPAQPGKVIFYNDASTTHYIAMVDGEVRNPYENLQSYNTQGYCQMFAFFLATGDLTGFSPADQTHKIDKNNFKILAANTQSCLRKTLTIIASDSELVTRFSEFFNNNIMRTEELRKQFGVRPGTTYDKYLNEFYNINEDLNYVMSYLYDNPLVGWKEQTPRPDLWFLPDVASPTFQGDPPQANVGGKNKKLRKTRRRSLKRK
jgi:hypothetical protein